MITTLPWLIALTIVSASDLPVIGVLSVPIEASATCSSVPNPGAYEGSCFSAFYVKWIEQAGVQVAVIPYDASFDQLDELFMGINGILFTGGGLSLEFNTTYYHTAKYLYKKVLNANDHGDYFPLWGTCQGFQLLNILTSDDWGILDRYAFNSENLSLPLDLYEGWEASRIFGSAPAKIMKILSTENVTENLHHDGIPPASFLNTSSLTSFYQILSTNKDRNGKEFISSMEAFHYPIYGVQWHPERPQFEWVPGLDINHSYDAITAMQYPSNFLGNEARKSNHTFVSPQAEAKALIYNYPLLVDPAHDSHQSFFFPPSQKSRRI